MGEMTAGRGWTERTAGAGDEGSGHRTRQGQSQLLAPSVVSGSHRTSLPQFPHPQGGADPIYLTGLLRAACNVFAKRDVFVFCVIGRCCGSRGVPCAARFGGHPHTLRRGGGVLRGAVSEWGKA